MKVTWEDEKAPLWALYYGKIPVCFFLNKKEAEETLNYLNGHSRQ